MDRIHRMENYFGHHPYVGAVISGAHVGVGFLLQATHLPPVVLEIFQLGAWGAAIAAGGFTCYGVWKTHHGKKKGRR
jgi:hypothetical protein